MSGDGSITLAWGDGEHVFRLAIGQFRELQERVNQRRVAIGAPPVGPKTLLDALRLNDAWPDDVRDVIRLGLVGGGMTQADVIRAMVNHFDTTGPLQHMPAAFAILLAGLVGDPTDPVGSKKKTETTEATGPSASPNITEPAPS